MIAMELPEQDSERRAGPLQVARTIMWAFFGVRRRSRHDADKLTPAQVIVAALIAAAVLVGTLVLVVSFVLSRVGPGA